MSTVFEGGQTPSNEPVNNSGDITIPQELLDLVGEGKKYKSVEDALKSVPHAQGHISNLEKELAELREDLEKRLNAEEALQKILEARKNSEDQGTPPSDFTPDALKDLVKSTFKEMTAEEKRAHNIAEADQAVREQWGDKAVEMLKQKAQELGVSAQFLQESAAHSPKAFFNLIGLNVSRQQQEAPRTGSVNTESMSNSSGVRPYSYKWYQQMRRENPKEYYTPKVQLELHRKAAEMGDDFYN